VPAYIGFYFQDQILLQEEAKKAAFNRESKPLVTKLREALQSRDPFTADAIQAGFKSLAAELGVKVGALVHPTRLACTGSAVGPSLYHLMEVLGKERVLERLDNAME
jgi:glutamyl-tRNA synthetase